MKSLFYPLAVGVALSLTGCGNDDLPSVVVAESEIPQEDQSDRPQIASDTLYNREAVIPPQCYTKTEGVNNPCYTCHQT